MRVIKQARVVVREGGEEHSGWLPHGTSVPERTPERTTSYDVRLVEFEGGFLLESQEVGAAHGYDSWFETLQQAERAAREEFGLTEAAWASS